tara:strand:+ start:1510 stop:1680 length:171 start_codon:yes stop_codon:yes gene_type:complete
MIKMTTVKQNVSDALTLVENAIIGKVQLSKTMETLEAIRLLLETSWIQLDNMEVKQ